MLTSNQKDKIVKKLHEVGAENPCPRCGNISFSLIDGIFNQTIQDDVKNIKLGGESLPTIVTVCTKCGFISHHALGSLGLMNLTDDKT